MSQLFGNLNGIAAGIYQMVLQKMAENPIPVPATDADRVMYFPTGAFAVPRTLAARGAERVSIADYESLEAAIAALPEWGGVVEIPVGRWPAGDWRAAVKMMKKKGVSLEGAKMPQWNADCTALENGSIIEGGFYVWADNFSHSNVGYDFGKIVSDRLHPGFNTHTSNRPGGGPGGWDAFAFGQPDPSNPEPARRNYYANNIRGLLRDSYSYGHAILQEGFDGGYINNVVGMYGIHAHVVKAKNITGGPVGGYGASANHVIFKSDTYATGGDIDVPHVMFGFSPPGTTGWAPRVPAECGLLMNPATAPMGNIHVGRITGGGATALVRRYGDFMLDGVTTGPVTVDGQDVANAQGVNFTGGKMARIKFGPTVITNVADAVAYEQTVGFSDDPIEFESLAVENVSMRVLNAIGYGRIVVGRLRAIHVGTVYECDPNARINIGYEGSLTYDVKFSKAAPELTAGWQQLAGGTPWEVKLAGYGVEVKGDVEPTGAPGPNVITLPSYLKSSEFGTMAAMAKKTGGDSAAIPIAQGGAYGFLAINGGVGIAGAEVSLSLGGLRWRCD